MPKLRVPEIVADVYHDLRDRHLLPLVAVLAVGIVAIPVALSGGSEPEEPVTSNDSAFALPTSPASEIIVTKANPGLRDYRRRLNDLSARDPFKQLYANKEEGAVTGGEEGEGAGGEIGGGEPTDSPPAVSPEEGPNKDESGSPTGQLKYFSWAIDVRVVPVSVSGKRNEAPAKTRRKLPELTMLPSRQTPAIVFVGPSRDGKKAIMLVSSDVKSIFGDAICVLGSETCQMLAMEPGVPETFVYGDRDITFRIELLKLRLLATDKLNRAPLGKSKESKKD